MKSHRRNNANKQKIQDVCRIILVVAIINFAVFFVIAILLGGDAINGNETAGHYYLANHGTLTEVSYPIFIYSKIHTTSLFITHPLAMIAGIIYIITGGKKENLWTFNKNRR
jgi:hypothetical protein